MIPDFIDRIVTDDMEDLPDVLPTRHLPLDDDPDIPDDLPRPRRIVRLPEVPDHPILDPSTPPDSPKTRFQLPPDDKPEPPIVPDPPVVVTPVVDPTPTIEPPKPEEEDPEVKKNEKLEDEEALKPPTTELPRFEFDDYESDEEDFLARQYAAPGQDPKQTYSHLLADPEEESKFFTILKSALDAYMSETGSMPSKMPIGNPNFPIQNHHLKAIARILMDPIYGGQVKAFHADGWPKLSDMGLKWILHALHHNKGVELLRAVKAKFNSQDGRRLVRFLAASPHIKVLEFPFMTEADDLALRALLQFLPENTSITSLNLEGVRYSETSFNMLLSVVSTNRTLEHLRLSFSDFSYHNRAQRFMQAIIDNPNTALKRIDFPLMRGTVLWTAQMLQYNQSLTHVDLSRVALGTHSGLLQAALKSNTKLINLDLSATSIMDSHLGVLLEPLWFNSTLQVLNLSDNPALGADSARNLGDMLMQNSGLTELHLDRLSGVPKDKLAKRLAAALKVNGSLHVLTMRETNTEVAGATALAEALTVNHGLQLLNLASNPQFDDACLNPLVKALKTNHGLHSLILNRCKIGDSSIKNLAPFMKTTSTLVVRLDLSDNKISQQSYSFLKDAINSNPLLRKLTLGAPTIQPTLAERLSSIRSDVVSFFSS
jgi:hypothetical protein